MAKAIVAPEHFLDLTFPVKGVDVSTAFGGQQIGTTPVGQNVRAFEPTSLRARGGGRAGLTKYLAGQVPGVAAQIQELTSIVDPQVDALGISFDDVDSGGDPFIDDFSTGIDLGGQARKLLGDGSVGSIRVGGSGFHTHKKYKRKAGQIAWVQQTASTVTASPGSTVSVLVFPTAVTQGNLLVVSALLQWGELLILGPVNDMTVSVTDNLGSTYAQASGYKRVTRTFASSKDPEALGLFYTIAGASGPLTLSFTPHTANSQLGTVSYCVMEFKNVDQTSPLDLTAQTGPVPGPAMTLSVPMTFASELAIGGFAFGGQVLTATDPSLSGSTLNNSGNVSHGLFYKLQPPGATYALNTTYTSNGPAPIDFGYMACGASFRKA